ncbi:ABC transporter permease [Chloroflexota bacterium]
MSADSLSMSLTRFRYRLADFPEAVVLVSFGIVFLFFSLFADHFLTAVALTNILSFSSILGIMVVGVAMLMICGEFDLSVGANFAVASYVFAFALNGGIPAVPAMILAIASSSLLGLINGAIVVWSGIPSFIATLGTMLAYRGIARAIGGGMLAKYIESTPVLFVILNGAVEKFNLLFEPVANLRISVFWFIFFVIVGAMVLRRSRFGNWVYATGGNAAAALAQGVPVKRVKLMTFTLVGLMVGIASVMQFSHRTSVDPLRGDGMELLAVASCVIGGIKLTGGIGTIFGAAVGVLLLLTLEQGLVLMGMSVQVFRAVAGLILMLSVILNTYLLRSD